MHPERFYEPGLDDFAAEIHERVRIATADKSSRRAAFARIVIGELASAADFGRAEFRPCSIRHPIVGHAVDHDRKALDLFVSIYTGHAPPALVTLREIEPRLAAVVDFVRHCRHPAPDEPAASIGRVLRSRKSPINRIRCFILTDARLETTDIPARSVGRADLSFHAWDLPRLHALRRSLAERDVVEIDLEHDFGLTLPCLPAPGPTFEYRTFLAIIPATVLHDMYARFGPRLIQPNVRSYLQARGGINRGIRATILSEPERFLAYNNGITVVTQRVELVGQPGSLPAIARLSDFQIINGVQTTASIFHAARRARRRLADVHVPAKIIEIAPAAYDAFLPLVSRYANSQNKVLAADFSANDSFHMRIEKLSRTVETPTRPPTRWFYERARGQYQEALARLPESERARFRADFPPSQRFTKLDMARYENTLDERPHVVCQGAEKNFADFSRRLRSRPAEDVDERFFIRLIARAIVCRRAEEIVARVGLAGHHAQAAAYTLAYIHHHAPSLIDLDAVWLLQDVTPGLRAAIELSSLYIYGMISNPIGARKVSEWCKKPACLDRVLRMDIRIPGADRPSPGVRDVSRAPSKSAEIQVVARSLELTRNRRPTH